MIQKVMNLGRICLGQNPNQLADGYHSRMLGQERDRNDQKEKKHSKSIKILHEEKNQVFKSDRSQAETETF